MWEALQKPNSNCIFPRAVAKGTSFLLWDIPVALLDGHHVWVDILRAQPASGTDLAERLHFGFGAFGSTAVGVQLQHFCQISAAGKEEEDLASYLGASYLTLVLGSELDLSAVACIRSPGNWQVGVQCCCKHQSLSLLV